MEILFKLCKYGTCGVSITGLEKDNKQYATNQEYLNTVSLNVMIPVDSKENEGDYTYSIHEHQTGDDIDQTIMEFPKDGLYRIVHAIVPKTNKGGYYYKDGKFYNDNDDLISVEVLIQTNPEFSKIAQDSQYTFSSCQLQECFYKYANTFLEDYCSSGKCYTKSPVEFDIIYIGIHVLKYLLDLNRLWEAQYILEKLTGCTGVCKQNNKTNIKGNGCGC